MEDLPQRHPVHGAAEAAVKVVKQALSNLGEDGVFSLGEVQTFLFMTANPANVRSTDARPQTREDSQSASQILCIQDVQAQRETMEIQVELTFNFKFRQSEQNIL